MEGGAIPMLKTEGAISKLEEELHIDAEVGLRL